MTTQAELLADLVAEAVRRSVGSVGVLVRDVSAPDPRRMLTKFVALKKEGVDLRIAYLRPGAEKTARELKIPKGTFSSELEQAERWRNDPNLDALIVVVAHGDEAKLSSLEDFATVGSKDLKALLVERALGEEAGQNEVQMRWWSLLAKDDAFGLAQLLDYYLALADKKGDKFLAGSSREIFRLGLLPDPELFNDPKESAVQARLASNRELLQRLQTLSPRDRKTIR